MTSILTQTTNASTDTRLFWVTRNGQPTKRCWSELTATEREQQREAEERQAYVAMFSIY